ncbi:MAG: UDP-N-acetylmuramoyl-tripeptide--D-alanyl-D-alanine ligase, partial [Noviherbaspirillum sp.]
LLTLGELAGSASNAFGARARHYDAIEALNAAAAALARPGATVLVKGSRFMRRERGVQSLATDAVQEAH